MRLLGPLTLALALACAGGGSSKDDTTDTDTPHEGDDAGECRDGADNDRDGDFDCDDAECAASPDCEEADTDADVDADTDTDADTDADADTDTAPTFASFTGTRRFVSDDLACDETVYEEGVRLDESDRTYDDLSDLCPTCAHFYEVEPERDTVCDMIGVATTWRGVVVSGSRAEVYLFRDDTGMEEYAADTSASFDRDRITFDYESELGGAYTIDIQGAMTFE